MQVLQKSVSLLFIHMNACHWVFKTTKQNAGLTAGDHDTLPDSVF